YVAKFPWDGGRSDGGSGGRDWWKAYLRRPNPSYNEYKFLSAHLRTYSSLSIYAIAGGVTAKYENNSIGQLLLRGASEGYNDIFEVDILEGRYFTRDELAGRNVVVIGAEVKKALFGESGDAIGKRIKIKGLKFVVIGVTRR